MGEINLEAARLGLEMDKIARFDEQGQARSEQDRINLVNFIGVLGEFARVLGESGSGSGIAVASASAKMRSLFGQIADQGAIDKIIETSRQLYPVLTNVEIK